MCGICGFVLTDRGNSSPLQTLLAMRDTLAHRGPDSAGHWLGSENQVFLGHRRLSILDLSSNGAQPMESRDGRYVVTFNGEIYNFRSLRQELQRLGHSFRGTSDTEVLLEAVSRWGVQESLSRFNGMFALGLWDLQEHCLFLARDRMGEKPLYHTRAKDGAFLFASQLSAFKAYPNFSAEIDRDALVGYLSSGYLSTPYSIYRGVRKLPPGKMLKIKLRGRELDVQESAYWTLPSPEWSNIGGTTARDDEESLQELRALALDAVQLRLASDVPLGAFLSGGVDSSTIVALMQSLGGRKVKTFTIGFSQADYDEAGFAAAVARHLGTDHTELRVSPVEAMAVIPEMPIHYDEPFADASQIPTYLVSRLARKSVTVALSGDGGDELFAGYGRYAIADLVGRKIGMIPRKLRTVIRESVGAFYPDAWDGTLGSVLGLLSPKLRSASARFRLKKVSEVFDAKDTLDVYRHLITHTMDASKLVLGRESSLPLLDEKPLFDPRDPISCLTRMDLQSYLPDGILVKLDRASMGVGLEARAPFLDHRVVEFCVRTPTSQKLRKGESKWLLRQLLYQYVPRKLIERPKMGFGVPIETWIRGPLRAWAEDLLDEKLIRRQGYFDPAIVRHKWQEHLSGKRNWQAILWDILMFQTWLAHTSKKGEEQIPCPKAHAN